MYIQSPSTPHQNPPDHRNRCHRAAPARRATTVRCCLNEVPQMA